MIQKEKIRVKLTLGFCNKVGPSTKVNRKTGKLLPTYYPDSEVPSLWLRVGISGEDKSWYYNYRPKGKNPQRIKLGPLNALTPALARIRAKQIQKEIFDGKDPKDFRNRFKTELTFGEELKNWMDHSLTVANGKKKSTAKAIRSTLGRWIFFKSKMPNVRERYSRLEDLRNKKISSITKEHVKKLHKVIGKPYEANRCLDYLRMFFNDVLIEEQKNPCKVSKKDKYRFKEKPYEDFLDNTELERVLDKAIVVDSRSGLLMRSYYKDNLLNPVSCLLVAFRLTTGRRTDSEAGNLEWPMVRENRIILKETKTSKHGTPTTFYLSDKAKEILQIIRKEKLQKYLPGPDNKDWFRNRFAFGPNDVRNKYVFPSRDFGRKIATGKICKTPHIQDTGKTWNKLLQLAGVDRKLKQYATRHTVASYILNNGGNIRQVMRVLGVSLATAVRYAKSQKGSEMEILNQIGTEIKKPLQQVN